MPTGKHINDEHPDASLTERISEAVEQTKGKLSEFGTAAADKLDQNRVAAATVLEGAAEKLSATAEYVRKNDLSSMMSDVEALVKKNPTPSLVVAAGLGFLIARAFSRDSRG